MFYLPQLLFHLGVPGIRQLSNSLTRVLTELFLQSGEI